MSLLQNWKDPDDAADSLILQQFRINFTTLLKIEIPISHKALNILDGYDRNNR